MGVMGATEMAAFNFGRAALALEARWLVVSAEKEAGASDTETTILSDTEATVRIRVGSAPWQHVMICLRQDDRAYTYRMVLLVGPGEEPPSVTRRGQTTIGLLFLIGEVPFQNGLDVLVSLRDLSHLPVDTAEVESFPPDG